MPERLIIFENHSPYHIITRGVDKRVIFLSDEDYHRFIFQLYAANFGSPAPNLLHQEWFPAAQAVLLGGEIPKEVLVEEHSPFVYILNFAMLSNHIHLTLVQLVTKGIQKFMHRLLTGYVRYFNNKYRRKGHLFEGRFQARQIKDERDLETVTRYINVNPLSVFQPDWKERGIVNLDKAIQFLQEYPWSSYPDFIGARKSHLLPPKRVMNMFYGNPEELMGQLTDDSYKKFIIHYLQEGEYRKFEDLPF